MASQSKLPTLQPKCNDDGSISLFKSLKFWFLAPAVLLFLLLALYPTLQAVFTSLHKLNLTNPTATSFIWLNNYLALLKDGRFWLAFGRSAVFVISSVGGTFLIGLFIALLLSQITKFRTFYQVIIIIPMVISPTVAAFNFRFMYNYHFGIINHILSSIGLGRVDFLGNTSWSLWSTIIIDIWQWTPLVILILLAGLETLPKEPYEAAIVDGATSTRIFFSLTLPMLKPFIVIAIVLRFMDSMKVFEAVRLVTESGPGTSSETLNTYLATIGFGWFEMGYASALGFLLLNITAFVAMMLVKYTKVFNTSGEGTV